MTMSGIYGKVLNKYKSITNRCKIYFKNASTNRRKVDQHVRTKYQTWSQNLLKFHQQFTKFDPKLVQRALGEGLGASLAPRTIKLRKCWFVGPPAAPKVDTKINQKSTFGAYISVWGAQNAVHERFWKNIKFTVILDAKMGGPER